MKITKFIKHHAVVTIVSALVLIAIMVIAGRAASKKPVETTEVASKQVTLVDATTFRDDLSTISVDGIVESVSQVDIKSQVSAPIARVYVAVGDNVRAGQTIVEFQNADIRAQLEQARANLTIAQGQYNSGNVSVDVARKTAIDRLHDAYVKTDDALNGQVSQFISARNQTSSQLQSYITDSSITNKIYVEWDNATAALTKWKESFNSLTDASTQAQVDDAIALAQKSLAKADVFLGVVSDGLSNAARSANQDALTIINNWKTITSAARTAVSASTASLTTAGGSIVTNQAQVTAAEAGVRNLEAQLAKTVVTSAIAGKIAALPLRTGEFASTGQLVTTVVGAGGLQVKAYASSDDIDRLTKGARVTLANGATGTVTAVSPSVNQLNKKVEVTIALSAGEKTDLVVGQNVQAKIVAIKASGGASTKAAYYILPIQNVKIIPGEAFVFTLDSNSKVVKNPVTLGDVKGDFVEIKSGITDDMKLISPVYELNEGDLVKI